VKSFVEFYDSLKISPVSQDIADLGAHLRRRDALYRTLGIPPRFVRGRRVLEFGPGSGHNSLHTALLEPGEYTLVDANPTGLAALRGLFAAHGIEGCSIVASMIEDFGGAGEYELVLCEGTLPFQADPAALFRKVCSHAAPGGVVVTTCIDPVSYFAEALRRFLARWEVPEPESDLPAAMERLRRFVGPHLATLRGMSRSHEDWILDNLVQPFAGRRLFGFAEAVATVGDGFSVHGASPHFLRDWRWYKTLTGDPREEFNGPALEEYWSNLHRFLDHRDLGGEGDAARNRELHSACAEAYGICLAVEDSGRRGGGLLAAMRGVVETVAALIAPCGMETALASLDEAARLLGRLEAGEGLPGEAGAFGGFFGRGQQYASFIRV
jgi:SAM-dependent methyltransferase